VGKVNSITTPGFSKNFNDRPSKAKHLNETPKKKFKPIQFFSQKRCSYFFPAGLVQDSNTNIDVEKQTIELVRQSVDDFPEPFPNPPPLPRF